MSRTRQSSGLGRLSPQRPRWWATAALILVMVLALNGVLTGVGTALADQPPGQLGYEGQPGNQGNGQQGYEGQPGNQGNGQQGYEGQPGNQGGG